MDILKTILLSIQVLSGILLICFVLLHSPKSDGVIGAGVSQFFASQKGAEASLSQMTSYVAGTFFLCAFITGYFLRG